MTTVLLMLQQAGVSAKQPQSTINAYFGKTLNLPLTYGKTADQLAEYDGVNGDDPAPTQNRDEEGTDETCAALPENTGPWKKFKKWLSKAVSDVGDAVLGNPDERTWQDVLNRLLGGLFRGRFTGYF